MAKSQKSNLKDTTDRGHISSLSRRYQPIHKYPTRRGNEHGMQSIREFLRGQHPHPPPPQSLREILKLILQENSFEFNDKNYLQIHGTAMGTKVAVAFANIFMSSVETEILIQSNTKPLEWKRYIDDTEKSLNGVTKLCDNLGLKCIMGEFE